MINNKSINNKPIMINLLIIKLLIIELVNNIINTKYQYETYKNIEINKFII